MKDRVLIIEDDSELSEVLTDILRFEKIDSVSVPSGSHAIEILENDSNFQLILLDWDVGRLGGGTFIQEFLCMTEELRLPSIPILIMGASRPHLIGNFQFVRKPFSTPALIQMIRSLLRSPVKSL